MTHGTRFFSRRKAVLVLLLSTLTSCANGDSETVEIQTASHVAPAAPDPAAGEIESPLGNYLAGRLARKDNDVEAAATYLERALKDDPENTDLMGETFLAMVLKGRVSDAIDLARHLDEKGATGPYTAIILAVHEIGNEDFAAASSRLEKVKRRGYNVLLAPLLMAWVQVGLDDFESAHESLDRLSSTGAFAAFQDFHSALITEFAGDHEAMAFY